ncbi:hypothetical protein TNCV_1835211 [Trichonephila clavipes]|nr:hypothetical protein TNCV_1835211 [Trichonephila clavipes]
MVFVSNDMVFDSNEMFFNLNEMILNERKLPPPIPIHVPAEKRPLEEKSLPLSKKRSKVRITPVIRRVSRRPEQPMAPGQIQPVQIPHIPDVPEPPIQIPHLPQPLVQIPDVPQPLVQIPDVPQPPVLVPPELNPLEPTDALDQFMSFVFGPPAQELQLLHTVPSIFDGDLILFLDEFERELAPMDLTMSRLNHCVKEIY